MERSTKYRICIGGAILIQVVCLVIAIGASWRVDHFVVQPGLILIFPWYFVAVDTVGWANMNLLHILFTIVFLFQWIIYGWFIGFIWERNRLWHYFAVIIIVHVLAMFAASRHFV